MEILIGAVCAILLTIFIVQIGRARELASIVRNNPDEEYEVNNLQAGLGMFFMLAFLVICVGSFIYYVPYMLGWGPNTAASEHGPLVDYMFNLTLFFTSIVFFVTQFLLFYFAWKYRGQKDKRAIYWAHNEKLEMVWMMIPAVVMTFLVVGGLQAWNTIMDDSGHDIEIEATGYQFAWDLRYPGRDGKLGERHFTRINERVTLADANGKPFLDEEGNPILDEKGNLPSVATANPLGINWEDPKAIDDFMPDRIVLPVGKKVRVRITSKDVLHNFYLPQFRVKMDAVPGMPTYFQFTPVVTTDSMRRRLSQHPEWQVADKNNSKKQRWETFNYELACAELCGKSHYSMRRIVEIVTEEEYLAWLDEQEANAIYLNNIRKDAKLKHLDPFKSEKELLFEKLLASKEIVKEQKAKVEDALNAEKDRGKRGEIVAVLNEVKQAYFSSVTATSLDVAQAAERSALAAVEKLGLNAPEPAPEETTEEGETTTPEGDEVGSDS